MAKLFIDEVGTAAMIALFEPLVAAEKMISCLTALEVRSAIRRRLKSKDLTEDDADEALLCLHAEVALLSTLEINGKILEIAQRLIDRHTLRALDAIQLATATTCQQKLFNGDRLIFISADKKLLEAAEAEGVAIWNPVTN